MKAVEAKICGSARVPAWPWFWLLSTFAFALLCLGAWTAVSGNHAMQWDSPAVCHGRDVCSNYCEYCQIVLSRSNTPCLDIPESPYPTMARWVWMLPVEPESPDTELAQGKVAIIHGLRPSGIACSGDVPGHPERIFRRLYLQKKALLC